MTGHTRRNFLKHAAAAGGTLALGQLGTSALAQDVARADMCIARWTGETGRVADDTKTEAIKLTEHAIAKLGGMGRFVSKGDVIWIKPNIAWNRVPELAANTNPDVVGTLVRLCLDAGAKKVRVGDRTCNDREKTYAASGIEAAAKEAGAQVVHLDPNRFKKTAIKGERLKEWPLYPELIESDLVINVPVAKHHSIAKATICMKNYMGCAGGERGQWHQDLATCLCDITAYMKPVLSVVDCIRVMTANGPTGGNLKSVKRMDIVAAGTDVVALDAFGTEVLGFSLREVKGARQAEERGLGTTDYRSLALSEIEVS